jgi:hypothetical protein
MSKTDSDTNDSEHSEHKDLIISKTNNDIMFCYVFYDMKYILLL